MQAHYIQGVRKSKRGYKEFGPAVCHEWFDNLGGGEKVLAEILAVCENPTIYTLWVDRSLSKKMELEIVTSFLQYFPKKIRRTAGLLFMPLAWYLLSNRISNHKIVISSSWAFAHLAGKFSEKSICYVHTPGRYWWLPHIDQRTKFQLPKFISHFLKKLDKLASINHGTNIANSVTTQNRISNFWGQLSEVIYPPVDLDFYRRNLASKRFADKDFLLGVGRFVKYKHHDSIIRLGERLGKNVILAGQGPELDNLKKLAEKSSVDVKIIENPSDEALRDLYTYAECLVYPTEEDFGIVPVEAMSCGTRILGIDAGGLQETVIKDLSGYLVQRIDIELLADGFYKLPRKDPEKIAKSVAKFSKREFHLKFIKVIQSLETPKRN